MYKLSVIVLCCFSFLQALSQSSKKQSKKNEKPVTLFTLNKSAVFADEFIYLYRKNHQAKPEEFTQEKILEYLDLYVNFKLKVEEARHRGMDTTQAFRKEFTTYRDELLKPYLPEARILDSLTKLTYDRMKEEVRAAHILISVTEDASPVDTLAAYNKIMEIRNKALSGEDFGTLAMTWSQDPSAKVNKGDLGYFTALQMVHPFETAAYTVPVGQISQPVRTKFGYHIVKVADRRPARGEVEVSHIMIRTGEGIDEESAKDRVFEIYDQLRAGAAWNELCRQYSEDPGSKNNGGKLRPFGAGAMAAVPEFEQAAFSLEKSGDISDPIKTAYGWHIIRLERKIPLASFDELAPTLKNRVSRDERLQISKEAWKKKLKKQFAYSESEKVKQQVLAISDSTVAAGAWSTSLEKEVLFSIQDRSFTAGEFLRYARKNQRRVNTSSVNSQTAQLFERFIETNLMESLASRVTAQNNDFKFLVNEYYEGILLFEIMEKEVWNKAVQDSAGLREFYEKNKSRFTAGERARAELYTSSLPDLTDSLKYLILHGEKDDATRYAREKQIKHESGIYGKDEKNVLSQVNWEEGVYAVKNEGSNYIVWIREILPPGPAAFEEAKATIVADYQQELEKKWLALLRGKYPVKVNEKGKRYILAKLQE